jgi:hypothetical protein
MNQWFEALITPFFFELGYYGFIGKVVYLTNL